MNVIDFVRETAEYMANDRPDLYDHEKAVNEIWSQVEALREFGLDLGIVSFSSYFIIREFDDGVESFTFTKKISGFLLCEEEEDSRVFSYDEEVNLPHISDVFGEDS